MECLKTAALCFKRNIVAVFKCQIYLKGVILMTFVFNIVFQRMI